MQRIIAYLTGKSALEIEGPCCYIEENLKGTAERLHMKPSVRKAVFPVAGFGIRFLPETKAMPKELLPVVNNPCFNTRQKRRSRLVAIR